MMNRMIKRTGSTLMLALMILMLACGMAAADFSMPVADGDYDVFEGLDENRINVLLIGTDTRENDMDTGRADTMMICSLHKQTGDVKIVSLSRDLWVKMGERNHQNRLNAAHTFGGANLLIQTINRTFDMNIEHYVTVNFYGICDIVDALGGVTINIRADEASLVNQMAEPKFSNVEIIPLEKQDGEQVLCGAQALAYARIRSLDNDIERQNRQRKLLMAIAAKVRECSILDIPGIISTCLEYVKTNLTLGEILPLAIGVLDHGISDIALRGIPQEGEYSYESGDGVSKLIINEDRMTEVIHQFIYQTQAQ
ncbi:MAG: LCP family protein [Clostridia bacterium]|nr:LCP family protein [Clostridia bacterium]